MNPRWLRNSFIYLLILVAIVAIFYTLFQPSYGDKNTDISTIVDMAKNGQLDRVEVDGNSIIAYTKTDQVLRSRKETEPGASIMELFIASGVKTGPGGVKVLVKDNGPMSNIFGLLINFLPLIFFGAVLLFMMRQAQGTNNQALSFGRSRARMFVGNKPTVTFTDVAGVDEAKQELQEVVEFLKYPEKFAALGARIPRGVLLVGPPGTGKTLLARAVAGEAGVPFFSISGSEFVEMFVGVGASRVRDLFDQAKRNAPCIIFVDEIDAVGRHRGAGLGGGHDEREQTLNQILVEMDGFDTNTNVIVLSATNRPDILDPALLRPGRFDRRVILDSPDVGGRVAILKVHTKGKPIGPDANLEILAKQTPGFTGADIANLVNEAAILAARRGKKIIGNAEFAEAIDRVIAGPERKSRIISPKEKEVTAYHEAGHALVGKMLPHGDPVHKISIVARGMMGGYTRFLPEEDRHLYSESQFKDMLATALGGRVAEELVFKDVTTGASNDLEKATKIANTMITRYGMANSPIKALDDVPISTLIAWAKSHQVKKIDVYGDDLMVTTAEDKSVHSRKETDSSILEVLEKAGIKTGPDSGIDIQVKTAKNLNTLGPRTYGKREELVFLGREISEQRDYSDKLAEEIDEEIRKLIDEAYNRAKDILTTHRAKLDLIAQTLIAKETIEGDELQALFVAPTTGAPPSLPAENPPEKAQAAIAEPSRTAEVAPPLAPPPNLGKTSPKPSTA